MLRSQHSLTAEGTKRSKSRQPWGEQLWQQVFACRAAPQHCKNLRLPSSDHTHLHSECFPADPILTEVLIQLCDFRQAIICCSFCSHLGSSLSYGHIHGNHIAVGSILGVRMDRTGSCRAGMLLCWQKLMAMIPSEMTPR